MAFKESANFVVQRQFISASMGSVFSVVFSGLDPTADFLKLYYTIYRDSIGTGTWTIALNGVFTNQTATFFQVNPSGTSFGSSAVPGFQIGELNGAGASGTGVFTFSTRLSSFSPAHRSGHGVFAGGVTAITVISRQDFAYDYNDSTTPITSISILPSFGSDIAIGSEFTLCYV